MIEVAFWGSLALILYAHAGYPLLLLALSRARRDGGGARGDAGARADCPRDDPERLPLVSLIVAAYDEETVIARRVRNALELDYPRERLEVLVASDGSADRTAEQARQAGADVVLELERSGKERAQEAAAKRAGGDVLAFSDANAFWEPDALCRLVAALADPNVGYVCGQVRFTSDGGANQEGLYWRYEMAIRALESRLGGITAGNGAIFATRRDTYFDVDPRGGDLSYPFKAVKHGLRAIYEPAARAEERMAPSIEGEFRRKRRMMSRAWGTVLTGGMLSPRGYGLLYAFEIASHRLLRYATPLLHVVALAANVALIGEGLVYVLALAGQIVVLAAAALAPLAPAAPLRLARYYVLMTASIAVGLVDWLRHGSPIVWEKVEGTR